MRIKQAAWWSGMALAAAIAAPLFVGALGCEGVKTSDVDVQLLRESEMESAISDSSTVILDVRKPERYAKGHIPQAINIFLPDIKANDPRLSLAKRIIVYGSGYTDPLGIAAVKRLLALGYQNVWLYSPGMEIWTESGHQVVTSAAPSDQRPETSKQAPPPKNTK